MNPIQKITNNTAWERYVRIKQLKQHAEEMMLVLGAELYHFQQDKQYETLDYDSFEAFLADPEIDVAPRTAYRMMRIYKVYILNHIDDMHLELNDGNKVEALVEKDPDYIRLLVATGVSKLDRIASYLTETNKYYLLNMASTNSRSSLEAELTNTEPNIETWRTMLQEARSLCIRLSQSSAPYEVREFANDFVQNTVGLEVPQVQQ